MGWFSGGNDATTLLKLSRIERKLDAIIAALDIKVPQDDMADIRDLAASGDKIAAIKEYRRRTGCSLIEAKEAVDRGL